MTNVTKEEYWTIILNDPTQIGQITTEDTEFNRRINDVNLVLSNTFINSSDENLISKWETSLYIDEIEGKTITERKADILYTLCEKNYVPVSIIKRFLLNLIGDENRFAVEFIKDENKLVIHTDRISDELMEAVTSLLEDVVPQNIQVMRFNHHIEVNWSDINKYAECKTVADMKAVNPNYGSDVTSDGEWVYPLPKLESAGSVFRWNSRIKKFKVHCPNVYDAELFLSDASNLEELHVEWNTTWRISNIASLCPKLHTVSGFCKSADIAYSSFSQSSRLRNYSLAVPNLRRATGFLNKAILTKESVIFLCNSLPSRLSESGCDITIGIHVDHQNDEDVLAAIAAAESKGWTLAVQWNGTSTTTASTMVMGSLIYAKVAEHELTDGTTEQFLDWGHYVTDETGYETFRSLESAYKYFNLEQPTEF